MKERLLEITPNTAYLQNFDSWESIEQAYECKIDEDADILLAWYGHGSYCGSSLVIYRRGDTLYEVNGSHCSCNGLEGQWSPEITTAAALKMRRLDNYGDYEGCGNADEALRALVRELEGEVTVTEVPF